MVACIEFQELNPVIPIVSKFIPVFRYEKGKKNYF